MDSNKLTNVYAATSFEPTEQEVQWIIDNVDVENTDASKWSHSLSHDRCNVDCRCKNNIENIEVDVYELFLDKNATDVPEEDWEYMDGRQLWVMVCDKCKSWALCD